ncbi:heme oxygenase 1 [Topomyia yanbarensis]|uniref:heme oxygenase 1 n=1 Tax=Topomyia yanbarensis TaxID=2498891 RepID=UPI00273B5205|nr:heme oxygenase 1 [Topomyia yanbarensis]
MGSSKMPFSKEMRLATRDIHSVSDALVNAKLAFALYDNRVWAEGLLIFYEIFKYLELHVAHDFLPEEFHRTQQFEQDLRTYLGDDWRVDYHPRKEVLDYIKHLEEVERQNPNLLVAYVYHLYMGLLSGGQILQKRKNMSKKFNPFASKATSSAGAAITTFEDGSIYELKQKMRKIVDDFGDTLDEDTRKQLVDESRKVFELNNCVIRTVSGVNRANGKIAMYVGIVVIGYFIAKLVLR